MKCWIFNPWGYTNETSYFSDGTALILSSGGYVWRQSGGSCLLT